MTVETDLDRAQYATNATTGPWTVPFYFLANNELDVTYTSSSGVDTTLTLDVDFSVVGAGDPDGGTVTTTLAYAAGGTITILRDVAFLQETEYVDGDGFPAKAHERALDRLTMIAQQLRELMARAITFPSSFSGNATLGDVSTRKGFLLGFDAVTGALNYVTAASGTALALAAQLAGAAGASIVGVIEAGPGALLKSLQDFFRESVGIASYPTAQQAVAYAFSSGKLLRLAGSNTAVVGNIPNLHDITIRGAGSFSRSLHTFYPRPTVKQTNNFYVDFVNGSDTNDGLTPDLAFKTSQRAFDVLSWYGPVLRGQWQVNFASATETTTTGATFVENLRPSAAYNGFSRIRLVAPADLSFKVDGGGVAPFGWNFNGNNKVDMFYVVHQNCTTYGYVAQDGCDINDQGCMQQGITNGPGSKVQGPGRWRKTNGRATTCQSGASAIGNVVFTFSGWQSDHNTQSGYAGQEGATGHADNCIFDNNPVQIDLTARARVHALGTTFTNASTCHVRGQVSSDFYDNPTTPNSYDTTAPKFLMFSGSVLTATQAQYTSWLDMPVDRAFVSLTGVTVATTVKTYAAEIPANSFENNIKAYRVRINGTKTGSGGTHNVVVNINGSPFYGFTIPAAATGPYIMEGVIVADGQSAQSYEAWCMPGTYMPPAEGSRSIAMYTGAALPVTVVVTPGNAADTITVRKVQRSTRGGGI